MTWVPGPANIGTPVEVFTTAAVTPGSATPLSSGLSIQVASAGTYSFEIYFYETTSAVVNNVMSFNFGSATFTSMIGSVMNIQSAGPAVSTAIANSTSTSTSSSATGNPEIQFASGIFVVNAGGTFIPGYATANTSTNSLLAGSWMRLTRIT